MKQAAILISILTLTGATTALAQQNSDAPGQRLRQGPMMGDGPMDAQGQRGQVDMPRMQQHMHGMRQHMQSVPRHGDPEARMDRMQDHMERMQKHMEMMQNYLEQNQNR